MRRHASAVSGSGPMWVARVDPRHTARASNLRGMETEATAAALLANGNEAILEAAFRVQRMREAVQQARDAGLRPERITWIEQSLTEAEADGTGSGTNPDAGTEPETGADSEAANDAAAEETGR
jgi:hypothetical protein